MPRCSLTISVPKYLDFFRNLREKVGPSVSVMAVVKANAYGLGALPLALEAQKSGLVDWFGVASVEEGDELWQGGIYLPLFLFSQPLGKDILYALESDLSITVYSEKVIREMAQVAAELGVVGKCHLKINTGMNRLGCEPQEAKGLAELILSFPSLKLEGVMTHFHSSDEPHKASTRAQYACFEKTVSKLNLPEGVLLHADNSAGCKNFPDTYMNMVRIGMDSYSDCVTLASRVQAVKWVEPGQTISYGATYEVKKRTQIATVDMGYADGVPRCFKGGVMIAGRRHPVVGHVCMDMLMVDVGEDPVFSGDEVVFVGIQGNVAISLAEFAGFSQRIPYESLCALGTRVQRLYC